MIHQAQQDAQKWFFDNKETLMADYAGLHVVVVPDGVVYSHEEVEACIAYVESHHLGQRAIIDNPTETLPDEPVVSADTEELVPHITAGKYTFYTLPEYATPLG